MDSSNQHVRDPRLTDHRFLVRRAQTPTVQPCSCVEALLRGQWCGRHMARRASTYAAARRELWTSRFQGRELGLVGGRARQLGLEIYPDAERRGCWHEGVEGDVERGKL